MGNKIGVTGSTNLSVQIAHKDFVENVKKRCHLENKSAHQSTILSRSSGLG
jgi:hypothetical protein